MAGDRGGKSPGASKDKVGSAGRGSVHGVRKAGHSFSHDDQASGQLEPNSKRRKKEKKDRPSPDSGPQVTSPDKIADGKLKGQLLPEPELNGKIPIALKERQMMFSSLGEMVRASRFLDLCAGTGMIGIEAISRGALLGTFVERKSKCCGQIRRNLKALDIKDGHGEIFEAEMASFLKKMGKRGRFWDVVFWDPPFDADYEDGFRFFIDGVALRPRGRLVLRHHPDMFFEESLGVLKRREVLSKGDAKLSVFERMA